MPKITKTEAAALLDKTPRAVERYAASGRLSVTYEKGKTRDTPVYDRAEVEALAEELRQPATPARGAIATRGDNNDGGVSQGVAIPPSQALQRAGSVEGVKAFALLIADALRGAQTPGDAAGRAVSVDLKDKLTLSFKEAARLSGVPESYLRIAYADGKLRGAKIGRGVRVTPDDVRRFVEQMMKGKR